MCNKHIRTDLMIVDPLLKGLQPKKFKEHIHRLRLGNIEDCHDTLELINVICF